MTTEIAWKIEKMDCYPDKEGQQDVVFNVHWRCNGSDGTYNSTSYGTQNIALEDGSPFIPYADLTQEQVIGWVKSAMGAERVAELEAGLAAQIETQKNPPVVSPPLPW